MNEGLEHGMPEQASENEGSPAERLAEQLASINMTPEEVRNDLKEALDFEAILADGSVDTDHSREIKDMLTQALEQYSFEDVAGALGIMED